MGRHLERSLTAVKYSVIINQVVNLYEPEIIIAHSVGAMATVYQESKESHGFIEKIVLLGGPDRLDVIMGNYQKLVGFSDRVYKNLDRLLYNTYGFNINEFNSSRFVSKIEANVLLIHSPEDHIVTFNSMEAIASKLKNVETYSSKSGGHSLHTQEVVDRILEFL